VLARRRLDGLFHPVVVVYHDHGGKVEVCREEIPMTLQVALVGTDGTVLASDKQVGVRNVSPFRSFQAASKLYRALDRGRLTCWAGDDPAATVAENILKLDTEDDPHCLEEEMRIVFAKATQALDGLAPNGEIMLLTTKNPKRIQYVQSRNGKCSSHTSLDKMVAGHNTNPATSFIELYYKEGLSVSNLIPLAAHTIVTAGRYNPAGIGGLEIVICTTQGFEFIKEQKIADLMKWAKKLDSEIGRRIFRH